MIVRYSSTSSTRGTTCDASHTVHDHHVIDRSHRLLTSTAREVAAAAATAARRRVGVGVGM
jgi:hypothetical protein